MHFWGSRPRQRGVESVRHASVLNAVRSSKTLSLFQFTTHRYISSGVHTQHDLDKHGTRTNRAPVNADADQ